VPSSRSQNRLNANRDAGPPDARHLGLTWGDESGPQAEAFPAACSLVEFRVRFSAWSELDDATRLETLKRCCADELEFRV